MKQRTSQNLLFSVELWERMVNSKLEGRPEQPVPWEDDPQDSRSPGAEINKSKAGSVDLSFLSF